MTKVKHVLGISGGKDSAALALYMNAKHPEIDVEYYTCDTGKELDETYQLIDRLESRMGKEITIYEPSESKGSPEGNPFDHFLAVYGGYLPSSTARWCTKKMKLEPFESQIGNEPTISYVGIRGDENREGYISTRENIQSIFPFRKNIWSEDVIKKFLGNQNQNTSISLAKEHLEEPEAEALVYYLEQPISLSFSQKQKLNALLDVNTKGFNKLVFEYLKTTDYPVGMLDSFPLIENEDIVVLKNVFQILEDSGVGIPAYYNPVEFEVEIDGRLEKATYSRSRSGCFFCFFQQKIEWVWLLEQHPKLFEKAVSYEKDGFTWAEEPLADLRKPERVEKIKVEYVKRSKRNASNNESWQDRILDAEGLGCASCFI